MCTLKICVRAFSGSIGTRSLKLYVHTGNELWYDVIKDQAHCSHSCLYLSIFLSFLDFCHIFPGTSKSRHFICSLQINKSSCIVIVTNRTTALIHGLFIQFFCFRI